MLWVSNLRVWRTNETHHKSECRWSTSYVFALYKYRCYVTIYAIDGQNKILSEYLVCLIISITSVLMKPTTATGLSRVGCRT
jgi:hypothetical protein